jgi:hypothetical protein
MQLPRAPKQALDLVRELARDPKRALRLFERLPFALRGLRLADGWATASDATANGAAHDDGALRRYFDGHQSGPGIWKWLHYFDLYERHFARFVGREVHLCEIGVFSGGSLGMWRSYFGSGCHVYGVDIEPACRAYEGERTRIFIGDQSDRSFWRKVRGETPQFDIVIDDGGHLPEQQIVTLEEVLPHLRAGGVYVCEDVSGESNGFSTYVRSLTDRLNSASALERSETTGELSVHATPFQSEIESVHFYPFVCVIEKRRAQVDRFVAPKHGTSWQPFLE